MTHPILQPLRALTLAIGMAVMATPTLAADLTMRVAGNFSSNVRHWEGIERPFFTGLAKTTGVPLDIKCNPMDVVNVKAEDALRLLRSNVFDVMSMQIGSIARDDPFFEGVDLASVSTDMVKLRAAMEAYRQVFDKRLQDKFKAKAKALTLWPFGHLAIWPPRVLLQQADQVGGRLQRPESPQLHTDHVRHVAEPGRDTGLLVVLRGVFGTWQRCGGLRRHLGQLRQLRQVAGSDTVFLSTVGFQRRARPFRDLGILEQAHTRPACPSGKSA